MCNAQCVMCNTLYAWLMIAEAWFGAWHEQWNPKHVGLFKFWSDIFLEFYYITTNNDRQIRWQCHWRWWWSIISLKIIRLGTAKKTVKNMKCFLEAALAWQQGNANDLLCLSIWSSIVRVLVNKIPLSIICLFTLLKCRCDQPM